MSDRPYVHSLVVDCAEPRKNADFYAELLGYEVVHADDEWVSIAGPGPMMSFQLAPDHVAPTWPAPGVPQQSHLDLFVVDIAAAHQRVLDLGGRAVQRRRSRPRRGTTAASGCTPTPPDTRSACAGPARPPGSSAGAGQAADQPSARNSPAPGTAQRRISPAPGSAQRRDQPSAAQ